ncbi:MAG: branched-chain amino acid ABC transporter permease [Bacillota bacterium]|nr:MAG: branched-chain amino acid ABC transporter permease [Bacillota bacterium]
MQAFAASLPSWEALLQALVSGLLTGGLYALLGLGMALIFGVMRIINLAHGELLMVGMYLTFWSHTSLGLSPYAAAAVGVPALFALGYLLERHLIGPVSRADAVLPDNQVLLTVGIGMVLTNVMLSLFSADYHSVPSPLAGRVVRLAVPGLAASGSSGTEASGFLVMNQAAILAFVIAGLATAGLWAFLTRTDLGRGIRATAQNREAAELLGLDTARVRAVTYGIGAALTGAAASLFVPLYYVYPAVGGSFTTKAFIVTVLGGMGSIPGAVAGGLLLGAGEAIGATCLGMDWKDAVGFCLFVLVLVLRPAGLAGRSRS